MRITILLLLVVSLTGRAGTIRAVNNGNWVLPGTWDCSCTPGKGDHVVIPTGLTVNVTRPVMLSSSNSIIISIAGELDLTNGALQIGPADQVVIMPGGRIVANGLGGTIYTGMIPYIFRSGTTVNGPFTIGDGGFPIALIHFNADVTGDHITFTWASAGEINVDRYNLMQSSDSINFEIVGATKGLGYSLRRHDYSYQLDSPASKKNIYRLEATGIDSTRVILSTIRVNTDK